MIVKCFNKAGRKVIPNEELDHTQTVAIKFTEMIEECGMQMLFCS